MPRNAATPPWSAFWKRPARSRGRPSFGRPTGLYLAPHTLHRAACMSFARLLAAALLAAAASAVAGGNPAAAQDRRVPSSAAEPLMSYAPLVKRVAPAVVNVYAARVVENRNPLLDDPMFRRFFGQGIPREQVQRSLGSGVIV